ncbi:sulfurtransferase TusA family protein [Litoreibacter arenae]|uniref:tRNA 5-methylaminomethyl-2-thiouridine synthase TusA n=1 Tax=Litoreibacter arenae DSM 19593 TaxID=1123360 RepID=S9QKU7_9RHOB|nr:sulfurtransferase TusA family protein [Litoreibacter arenae]EPX80218.1 tRNA 5-methylaminomethyl-2-thiouridine synthase TusA [Litoreibacter arenae DSM 19593]
MDHDAELDALGLLCPLPVLKARKRLQALASGQVLRVLADDPAALIDMPHFCAEAGHELVGVTEDGAHHIYLLRKA